MLRSYGVEDFVAASRLLAARRVRAGFVVAGGAGGIAFARLDLRVLIPRVLALCRSLVAG